MELAKLILEYAKALAWPVTVVIIALAFRAQIRTILSRLRKAGLPGGISIDFQEEIQQVKQLSEKVEESPAPQNRPKTPSVPLTEANARMISLGLRPTASGLDMSYFRVIAERDPNLALAGLRIDIEVLANNLADGFKISRPKAEPLTRLVSRLLNHQAITAQQADLTRRILRLCNEAVHGRMVTKQDADEVIDAATVLSQQYLSWLSWGFPDDWKPKDPPPPEG
jgi:hypothetical protein